MNGDVSPFCPRDCLGNVLQLEELDIEFMGYGLDNMIYVWQFFLFSSCQDIVGLRVYC